MATAGARIRPALGARAAHFEPLIAAVSHFITRVDPPDHARLRALVQKAFTNQAVEATRLALEGLLARWPALAPVPGPSPRRRPNFGLRGFTELLVALAPASRRGVT